MPKLQPLTLTYSYRHTFLRPNDHLAECTLHAGYQIRVRRFIRTYPFFLTNWIQCLSAASLSLNRTQETSWISFIAANMFGRTSSVKGKLKWETYISDNIVSTKTRALPSKTFLFIISEKRTSLITFYRLKDELRHPKHFYPHRIHSSKKQPVNRLPFASSSIWSFYPWFLLVSYTQESL